MIGSKQTNCRRKRRQTWHNWVCWHSQSLQAIHSIISKLASPRGCKCGCPTGPMGLRNHLFGYSAHLLVHCSERVVFRPNASSQVPCTTRGKCQRKLSNDRAQTPHRSFHPLEGTCIRCIGCQRLKHMGIGEPLFITSTSAITCADNGQSVYRWSSQLENVTKLRNLDLSQHERQFARLLDATVCAMGDCHCASSINLCW